MYGCSRSASKTNRTRCRIYIYVHSIWQRDEWLCWWLCLCACTNKQLSPGRVWNFKYVALYVCGTQSMSVTQHSTTQHSTRWPCTVTQMKCENERIWCDGNQRGCCDSISLSLSLSLLPLSRALPISMYSFLIQAQRASTRSHPESKLITGKWIQRWRRRRCRLRCCLPSLDYWTRHQRQHRPKPFCNHEICT